MGPNDLLGSKDPVAEAIQRQQLSFKGLPYEGKPYTVDEDTKPVLKKKVHTEQFNLPKDMKKYNDVLQGVADGHSIVSFEERVYDKELCSWRVLIRWFDLIYTEPKKKKEVPNV